MHLKLYPLIVFLSLCISRSFSQSSVSGSITDSTGAPASFVSVGLLKVKDSSVVRGNLTNEKGEFFFENIAKGSYFVKVSSIGYKDLNSDVFTIDTIRKVIIPEMRLESKGINLNEVAITVTKKPIEFKNGNITVNIDGNPIAVGNSIYDLLTKMPGVTVIDDNISIQGKSGIRVMIDDRIQQLTGAQLINLLRSINASSVDKIEILKNPPVKYDASGSGLINIKTKKVKITGFSGSANLSYQQGYYSNKDGGFSLNYKGKKFAVFSNVNSGLDEYRYLSIYEKTVTYNDIPTFFDQRTYEKSSTKFISGEFGTDFYLNKKNTIGFKAESRNGGGAATRYGNNYLSNSTDGYNQLEFNSTRPVSWSYVNYNLNSEHTFDTLGTTLRTNFDFSPANDHNAGDYGNKFLDSTLNQSLPAKIFKGDNQLDIQIMSGKIDFEKTLWKKLKMETGGKVSDQQMKSNYIFQRYDNTKQDYFVDSTYTNRFNYTEDIASLYLNFNYQAKKFGFALGSRGENTAIKAGNVTGDVSYTRNYFNLFPFVSLDYNPSENHHFQLMYNKRIERPNYFAFNPYKYFINLYVSSMGNPYMRPTYFDAVELSHSYKGFIFNSLNYTHIQNAFFGYPVQNDSTKESINMIDNLKGADNFTYNLFLQKEIKKWAMININLGVNYITFAGKVNGRDYSGKSIQGWTQSNVQFNLPKSFKIDLSCQYYYPGNPVIYRNYERWSLNLALKKGFLDNKLNVVIGANDIFFTMVNRNSVDYLNIHSTLYSSNDTRRFRAYISYNFGKIKVQQRQAKGNDEKRRMDH